ncbi:hypothetical protein JCM10213_001745 [Rhodosporidiobolus nylandii]
MASGTPTPSSEIIHLVSTFTDALDSLPPSLTRSLSDLKELDAVLNSSLQSITDKLKLLHEMMHTPEPGAKDTGEQPKYTPLDRLKLLREVAEDARVFRLGGEDKIRVATNTCETISTHTSHLSTLSTLLLGFLPSHLIPHLPAPSAPHGYPQSNTSLRGRYDYSAARHAGQGSTSRLSGALGMVREHYDMTRGRHASGGGGAGAGGAKKRAVQIDYSIYGDDYGVGGSGSSRRGAEKDKDASQRHPNQYTKKRMQAAGGGGLGSPATIHHYGGGGAVSAAATNAAAGVYSTHMPQHQAGMSAVDAAKEKRRANENVMAPAMSQAGNGSRAGSVAGGVAGQGGQYYAAGVGQDEYGQPMYGQQRGAAKRKPEELAGGNKRRKKGANDSPDPAARTLPASVAATSRAPRRQGSTSTRADEPPSPPQYVPMEEEFEPGLEGEEDQDKTLYCFCQRVSFGEMIACDAPDCEHEWFHLPCVGLKSIPDGRWFCDECKRTAKGGKKGRR